MATDIATGTPRQNRGMTTPTPRGVEKWPPDGYYTANGPPGDPCTCKPECSYACKGDCCGCVACHNAYQDFGIDDR